MNTKIEERAKAPAYPVEVNAKDNGWSEVQTGPSRYIAAGLTIREHFAGLAMQGIRAATNPHTECALVAEMAVKQADTLIAALNQEQGK